MKKEAHTSRFPLTLLALATLVLSSCVPNVGTNVRARDASAIAGSSKVGLDEGRVLLDNPIILSKNANLAATYDLNKLLSTATITSNSFLKGGGYCFGLESHYCFEVREMNGSPSALQTSDGKWGFNASSAEFLQVNTFYHLNAITDLFFSNLHQSYSEPSNFPFTSYAEKDGLSDTFKLISRPLTAYANCDASDNAYYDHANSTLCLGYVSSNPKVKWAQDGTVIYHEAGHFFQKLQLNLRNDYLVGPKVDMGNSSYDEAGSIGEGLADFYSYFVNGRTHFAEWAAGRFLKASRPLSERDALHVSSLSTDSDQRLSYPDFLGYNPNASSTPVEDIHYSGMIISHYLVALSEDLTEKCSLSKRDASDFIVRLISETLAEHGDLKANGRINMSNTYSSDWFRIVNPINYRSFMQTFAKNLLNNLSGTTLSFCYNQDYIESLIDQYGLLLFRTYNENRNLEGNNTAVTSTNRKKSVLISKSLLILDPAVNASSAFVIDNRDQIKKTIDSLRAGKLIGNLSSQIDLDFNNNNGKMSPGEIVALALNLYNNSNTTMGGVQILANDWNHANPDGKPYIFPTSMANDQWPLASEGGTPFTTSIEANDPSDFAPICFMQLKKPSATEWVSQEEFATQMALDHSFCLDSSKPRECFIRAIKGADQAYYSKINPKSTWGQTLYDPVEKKAPTLSSGNVILFEVSKHIPPGTVVDCRLRMRFTNCDDCYHDSNSITKDDYLDSEYNGPRPYKIIHLQIPIVD